MITDLRARMRESGSEGFTLIELLIVVVIIGILAAIAIPQFSSTKEKAFDASAKSDLRNAMTSMESYFVENQDYNISGPSPTALPDFNTSTNVDLAVAGDADSYAIVSKHTASDNYYFVCGGDGENGQVQQSGGSAPSSCSGGTTLPSVSF